MTHASNLFRLPAPPANPQVAYHRFTATWLGYRDGVRPQAKDTVQAMFCKECTEVGWTAAAAGCAACIELQVTCDTLGLGDSAKDSAAPLVLLTAQPDRSTA